MVNPASVLAPSLHQPSGDHGDPAALPGAYEAEITAVNGAVVSILVPGYSTKRDWNNVPYTAPTIPRVGGRGVVVFTDERSPFLFVAGIADDLDGVRVTDFGAVGDGTTDDTAAIQAAIDYVAARGGGTVWFPSGDYGIALPGLTTPSDVPIRLRGPGVPIRATVTVGANYGGSRLRRLADVDFALLTCLGGPLHANRSYSEIENLAFVGTGGGYLKGLVLERPNGSHLRNLYFQDCAGGGLVSTDWFNGTADRITHHGCGFGADHPAFLFDQKTEAQGASSQLSFSNFLFLASYGTDIKMTGDATSGPTESMKWSNVAIEGGGSSVAAALPFLDLAYAQLAQWSNVAIHVRGAGAAADRTVEPIQIGNSGAGAGTWPIQFSNLNITLANDGGTAVPYAIKVNRWAAQFSNLSVISAGSGVTNALVRYEAFVPATCPMPEHINTNSTKPWVSDARTPLVPVIDAAATITLTPRHREFFSINAPTSGATPISTITADRRAGETVTLYIGFASYASLVEGGNLKLAGDFDPPFNTDGMITLISNGQGSWFETSRALLG